MTDQEIKELKEQHQKAMDAINSFNEEMKAFIEEMKGIFGA